MVVVTRGTEVYISPRASYRPFVEDVICFLIVAKQVSFWAKVQKFTDLHSHPEDLSHKHKHKHKRHGSFFGLFVVHCCTPFDLEQKSKNIDS